MKGGVVVLCTIFLVSLPFVSAAIPNPGHEQPQLECTSVFCIDDVSAPLGVAVGTTSAITELTVFGDKGIQWSDGTKTWRLGRYHDDVARGTWAYFTGGSGTSYENFAAGRLWAQTDICIDGDCRTAWPGGAGGALSGSGTVNRIAKFTAAQNLADSSIFDNGNVGIGTTGPTQLLDVNGKIRMRTVTAAADPADTVATKGYVDGASPPETDPTVIASVKDGVSWAEVSGKPAGFADNVDDVGIAAETDPQVAAVTSGNVCRGSGTAVTCDIMANSDGHVRGGTYGTGVENSWNSCSSTWPMQQALTSGGWPDGCQCPGGYSMRWTGSKESGQSASTTHNMYTCWKS